MQKSKTKIVCTIGPSSWDPNIMKNMIAAGMDTARVNGAFADTDELDKVNKLVRQFSSEVALMMDVKGPEVRMNKFSNPIPLQPGQQIEIGNGMGSNIYPANYKDLYKLLKVGQRIVIGDGDVELVLKSIKNDKMQCEVVFGDLLKPGKALNLPGAEIATSALTEKDIINLKHSIKTGWNLVSASFIQNAKSAKEIKEFLGDSGMKLIAKIEDQQGVDNINEILREVDGIMVARGGLGVELGLEEVPNVQRHLIQRANAVGKPVITATQMLESMTNNPRPTRAEANDVATAIYLGSDAVMLSGESSAGKYPVEAVEWMNKIALSVEGKVRFKDFGNNMIEVLNYNQEHYDDLGKSALMIAESAAMACRDLDIKKVFVVTKSGFTARVLSRYKIQQDIYAFVPNQISQMALNLTSGVNSLIMKKVSSDRDLAIKEIISQAKSHDWVIKGDLVAIVVGAKAFSGIDASMLDLLRVG